MINKEDWESGYIKGATRDCPYCGKESPEHVCRECYSDIDRSICWANNGYCKKCFQFIHEEIPKIKEQKNNLGVQCKCDTALCAKCLGGNCKDDDCPVHTKELKTDWLLRNKR